MNQRNHRLDRGDSTRHDHLDALAHELGIDINNIIARDDALRRGAPLTWNEFLALGLDPETGEPK